MSSIVVAGPLANKPYNGGGAWSRLTLVRGFLRLGLDAHLVEEIPAEPESASLAFFREAVSQLGLERHATLVCGDGEETVGLGFAELCALAEDADLLLNVSGHLQLPALKERFRRKAYLDLDPGYTQYWQADGNPGGRLEGHDVYFTVGANIGKPGCPIPTCGIDWRPTRQMVVLGDWPEAPGGREEFTTVSSWRGPYGPIEADGTRYGTKVHEFRRVVELPERTGQRFELALDIHPDETADLELLDDHGWKLVEPRAVAGDPNAFRRYVQESRAEFCVAQGVYVGTGSGWFSDRTVRYLASGKPALVQDTGFRSLYPTGAGLVPFATLDEAVAGAESIARDYDEHSAAARALAARYFDTDVVLPQLLADAGVAA